MECRRRVFAVLAATLFAAAIVSARDRSFTIDYMRDTFLKDGIPFRWVGGCGTCEQHCLCNHSCKQPLGLLCDKQAATSLPFAVNAALIIFSLWSGARSRAQMEIDYAS